MKDDRRLGLVEAWVLFEWSSHPERRTQLPGSKGRVGGKNTRNFLRGWQEREPATNPPDLARRALAAVYGVDLNPFAAEISRFRLLIAALEASGEVRLRVALALSIQVAAGDSLLHGSRPRDVGGVQTGLYEDRVQFFYETEDADEVKRILSQAYHVVVGNPPYINVNDAALRDAYRERFSTCHGSYQLGVPFTERFFDLTVYSDDPKQEAAGWMGMIVSNAFMKRTFGKKLVENYLGLKDLTHVIDTSGVYLPGHGTPTTILLGRNMRPVSQTIRAVRGIRGETGVPDDPPTAPVWMEIVQHLDEPGFTGNRVSVTDAEREAFSSHPWSIGGGGAAELRDAIESEGVLRLNQFVEDIGYQVVTRAEDAFLLARTSPPDVFPAEDLVRFMTGEDVRDWCFKPPTLALWPYDQEAVAARLGRTALMFLQPLRIVLRDRVAYGLTQLERGLEWFEYSMIFRSRLRPQFSVAFGEITTHNHFVLDRGAKFSIKRPR